MDRAPRREIQLVALQPVAHRFEQGQRREQHREMRLHLRRDALQRRLQPDAAVEIVGHQRNHQHDDQRRERPVHQELVEGQPEDVEAQVLVEQGVLRAELHVGAVSEEDPFVPLALSRRPRDGSENDRDRDTDEPRPRADHRSIAREEFLFRAGWSKLGRDPVGDEEVGPQHDEEHRAEHDGQQNLRAEHALPHACLVQLGEPEVVGPEAGDPT